MAEVLVTFRSQSDADQFLRDEIAEQYGATVTLYKRPKPPEQLPARRLDQGPISAVTRIDPPPPQLVPVALPCRRCGFQP